MKMTLRSRRRFESQAHLGELTSQVGVVEGYYDLDTGKVEWTAK